MTVLNEVIEEIHRNQNFIISTHVNPEGDALGSALGLALGLQSAGKKALVVNRDPVPQFLDFLPHQDIFQQRQQVTEPYDVLAVLDCGDLERTAIFDGKRLPARRVINIDHHITNRNFGHVNWVNVDATSTGEMIYELLKAMNIPISPEIADCLYTSVVTETGSFRYSNTSERTFRIASELVGCGVQPWRVAQQLFQRNRVGKLRLLALILNGMEVNRDGRMAWIRVSQADFSSTGTTAEDTEDFVNYPRSIEGVEVALLFREVTSDTYKVSFRSRGRVDVAALAERFGGGGHRNAAGCTVAGGLQQVKDRVLRETDEAIQKTLGPGGRQEPDKKVKP